MNSAKALTRRAGGEASRVEYDPSIANHRLTGPSSVLRATSPGVLVTGLVTLVVFGIWDATDGGYAETTWYPAGVVLVLLAAMLAWSTPQRRLGRRSTLLVVGASCFTAWSYASLLWAGDRGLALTGANRSLVYLLLLAVMLRQRWQARDATWYLAVWAATVVVVGCATLLITAGAPNIESRFAEGRLSVPIDYANANAALFVLAAWPLIVLAAARAVPAPVRGLALALSGVATEIALLSQSKGAALGSAATIVVLLLVLRERRRIAISIVAVGCAIALFHTPLFDLYTRLNDDRSPRAAMHAANLAIGLTFVVLFAVGVGLALIDRRIASLADRRQVVLARAANAVGVLAIGVALAAAGVRFGNPVSIVRRSWHAFKYPPVESAASSHYLSTAGNHRFDFWRVASDQFVADPVLGAGADNFAATYVRLRRSDEEPLYPHSLEASLLGGNGLVGASFFALFASIAAAVLVRLARSGRSTGVAAAGILGLACYWFAHGSVDWLWPFPALTGPVFALVGLAVAVSEHDTAATRIRLPAAARRAVAVAALAFAAIVLVPAWLAARDSSLATEVWRTAPSLAYARLDSAARLNPFSDEPYLVAGTIAEQRRDWSRVRTYFTRAVARNPANWYSHLELAIAAAEREDRRASLNELATAHRLDPREPLIDEVRTAVRDDRAVPVEQLDHQALERANLR